AAEARLFSVERDAERAKIAADVFADDPRVHVRTCDWRGLADAAPFDLLFLDGGGQGKGGQPPLDPARWLRPGGIVVVDDLTPMTGWPPTHEGVPDHARMYWLEHPRLRAAEIRGTPTSATIVATFIGRGRRPGPGRRGRHGPAVAGHVRGQAAIPHLHQVRPAARLGTVHIGEPVHLRRRVAAFRRAGRPSA